MPPASSRPSPTLDNPAEPASLAGMIRRWALRIILTGAATAILAAAAWHLYLTQVWYHRFDTEISAAAMRYGVAMELVSAVIWRESRFDPERVGTAGELGLMQITTGAAAEWVHAEGMNALPPDMLLNPQTNICAGTWYLARALSRWDRKDDPVAYALAEYNAGLSNVRRWEAANADGTSTGFRNAITYPGTRQYVESIIRRYRGRD